jgi:serine/tyrosine/threonine adenylyltransferase
VLQSSAVNEIWSGAKFDNSFVRDLPGDARPENQRRQVLGAAFSRVAPTRVAGPALLAYSPEVADLLGLTASDCQSEAFAQVFAGNRLLAGMDPYAACYGGHQFGSWAGQLGDGRALSLGEVINARGERWELQLKGAGPTPYSRSADGRAVLRSSLREFLCSEAMHHLGVPTTRALSLVLTGEQVVRDMFYDGRPQREPGAVVCRVAPSFLRFGNFELPASRRDLGLLRSITDYAIKTHFAELGAPSAATYVRFFEEVCRRTALMVTHWMRVGFVHGVMNTDNMSVLGLTIDYGPYGWLEDYDPDWTPNTTDAGGRRYRYGQQGDIALWNLACFGSALVPLCEDPAPLQAALEATAESLEPQMRAMWQQKLGLGAGPGCRELVDALPRILRLAETDMTIFFRGLAELDPVSQGVGVGDEALLAPLMNAYYAPESLTAEPRAELVAWLRAYLDHARREDLPAGARRARMNAVNPKYVLRNYLAQLAIDKAEQGDASMLGELLAVLRDPYGEQPQHESFAAKRPEWARHRPGCSMLSCSS